jgi:hypothetical protein
MNLYMRIKCNLCEASVGDISEAHNSGWDWFTGVFRSTFHVCPSCRRARSEEVSRIRNEAMAESLGMTR